MLSSTLCVFAVTVLYSHPWVAYTHTSGGENYRQGVNSLIHASKVHRDDFMFKDKYQQIRIL